MTLAEGRQVAEAAVGFRGDAPLANEVPTLAIDVVEECAGRPEGRKWSTMAESHAFSVVTKL